MDPATLATNAITLLGPYLAKAGKAVMDRIGKDVADAASGRIESLYEEIKRKLGSNDCAKQSLKRLEEMPNQEERREDMRGVLKELLVEDAQFRAVVEQMVEEEQRAAGIAGTRIVVSGSGAVVIGGVGAGQDGQAAGGNIITGGPHN